MNKILLVIIFLIFLISCASQNKNKNTIRYKLKKNDIEKEDQSLPVEIFLPKTKNMSDSPVIADYNPEEDLVEKEKLEQEEDDVSKEIDKFAADYLSTKERDFFDAIYIKEKPSQINIITKSKETNKQIKVKLAKVDLSNLLLPVKNYERISSNFGKRKHPIRRFFHFHKGIDIAGSAGTPIYAAESGIVSMSRYSSSYGNIIAIQHDESFSTVYAHNQKNIVEKGDYVRKGQLIGYIGSSGLTTGPHLHFETRINNKPVNPVSAIKQRSSTKLAKKD